MKLFSFDQKNSAVSRNNPSLIGGLTALLVPPTCPLCGSAAGFTGAFGGGSAVRNAGESMMDTTFDSTRSPWCNRCRVEMDVNRFPHRSACHACGGRLPVDDFGLGGTSRYCASCETDFDRPIDRMIAAYHYNGQVCKAIVAAKYSTGHAVGCGLGSDLAAAFCARMDEDRHRLWESSCQSADCDQTSPAVSRDELQRFQPVDFVTHVPSHLTRRFVRGGCGISAITRTLARRIDVPMIAGLRTTRRIEKQAWLDDPGRKRNVCGAFAVKKRYDSVAGQSPWSGCHAVLVDDVMTTGSTCREVARVLRDAGVSRVTVAVIARATRT